MNKDIQRVVEDISFWGGGRGLKEFFFCFKNKKEFFFCFKNKKKGEREKKTCITRRIRTRNNRPSIKTIKTLRKRRAILSKMMMF